jgi:3-dehydroquinate synthase
MVLACRISEQVAGLDRGVTEKLTTLLSQYHLPVRMKIDATKAMEILKMDKKRNDDLVDYIVLEKPGQAAIRSLPFSVIEKALRDYEGGN